MGHLEYVRAQVGAGVEQRLLRLHFGVARQQDPGAVDAGPQDQRVVVGVGVGVVQYGARAQHVKADRPHIETGADRRSAQRQPVSRRQRADHGQAGLWLR
jgi:hypothetical protein